MVTSVPARTVVLQGEGFVLVSSGVSLAKNISSFCLSRSNLKLYCSVFMIFDIKAMGNSICLFCVLRLQIIQI